MSRAGKHPIKLKDGVSAAIAGDVLNIKGPKGELVVSLDTKHAGLVDVATLLPEISNICRLDRLPRDSGKEETLLNGICNSFKFVKYFMLEGICSIP